MTEPPAPPAPPDAPAEPALPEARLRPVRRGRWVWLIPLAAVGLAVFLTAAYVVKRGPVIVLQFTEGHGLKPRDTLRCRGIVVGEVESVRLAEDLGAVEVRVRLDPHARPLARAGSRFWVVRPVAGLTGISGLETIAGPRYLAVIPGEGPPQARFVGLDEPPVLETVAAEGLEVMLLAARRGSLRAGAPVMYRGVRVGTVLSVGLASDAASIEARTYIRPAYAALVREDSRFWQTGGVSLELGLSGLNVTMETLPELLMGGVALATPDPPGRRAAGGQRFTLAERAEEDWLEWRPALPVGSALLPAEAALPAVVRVTLREPPAGGLRGLLGGREARSAWAVAAAGGLWLPADTVPAEAARLHLEVAGREYEVERGQVVPAGRLAMLQVALPDLPASPAQARALTQAEDLVLLTDRAESALPMAAVRLHRVEDGWRIDPTVALSRDLHGAAVLARRDGRLVGLLTVEKGQGWVAPWPTPEVRTMEPPLNTDED